jgi:hypothetical protein
MSDQPSLKPVEQVLSGVIRRDAIEDMSGAVRNFFDLHAVQLEPGPCHCQIDFIAAGNTFLYREHYPIRTQLRGELLHNRFGVAIPGTTQGLQCSGEEGYAPRGAPTLVGGSRNPSAQCARRILASSAMPSGFPWAPWPEGTIFSERASARWELQ